MPPEKTSVPSEPSVIYFRCFICLKDSLVQEDCIDESVLKIRCSHCDGTAYRLDENGLLAGRNKG